MGRCCNGLMICFRVLQFLLSLVAMGCGAFIVYQMFSLSETAGNLQDTLDEFVNITAENAIGDNDIEGELDNTDINDAAQMVREILTPLLEFLQGTPARAIIITAVSSWSICVIVYLIVAQRKAESCPTMNCRRIRVSLEVLTLTAWIIAIACTTLLCIQFGALALAGAPQSAFITRVLSIVLRKQLQRTPADSQADEIAQALDLVGDIVLIGVMSILAMVSAVVCTLVSLLSLIVSYCIGCRATRQTNESTKSRTGKNGILYTPMRKRHFPTTRTSDLATPSEVKREGKHHSTVTMTES